LYYKPNHASVFVALGDAHLEQGRKDDALAAYRLAMRNQGDLLKVYPGVAAKLARSAVMPVAISRPVSGHLIMTTPMARSRFECSR
jgi:hypothetical protein